MVHVPRPCFCPCPKGGLTDRLRVNKRAPYSNGPFVIILSSLSLSLVLRLFMFVVVFVFLCFGCLVFGLWEGNHGTRTISYLLKAQHTLTFVFVFFYNRKKTLQVINQKARPCHNKNNMQNRHIRAFAVHY
ncbi:hypothetical protein BKA57DRAFT_167340 [Linnemannia elongata]|nr:hypothetical protein BKA57DRAFT_167340 [Linnemannia elongata]